MTLKENIDGHGESKYSDIYEESREKVFKTVLSEWIFTSMKGKDFLRMKLEKEGFDIIKTNNRNIKQDNIALLIGFICALGLLSYLIYAIYYVIFN